MINAANIFRAAHAATRAIVAETGGNYRIQFALCLKAEYAGTNAPASAIISTNTAHGSYIARITGKDARYGIAREFCKNLGDGTGPTGYAVKTLAAQEGEVYEIKTQQSRKSVVFVFVAVRGGKAIEITRDEAIAIAA